MSLLKLVILEVADVEKHNKYRYGRWYFLYGNYMDFQGLLKEQVQVTEVIGDYADEINMSHKIPRVRSVLFNDRGTSVHYSLKGDKYVFSK